VCRFKKLFVLLSGFSRHDKQLFGLHTYNRDLEFHFYYFQFIFYHKK